MWFLIADLHFSHLTLERNAKTFEWIITEFGKKKPSHVIILGDVVHSRGTVHLRTYAAVTTFISRFVNAPWKPNVHIIVGNHDMLEKENRTVNSLQVFSLANRRVHIYSEITEVEIDNIPCSFIPYHHDQRAVSDHATGLSKKHIVFGHLSVDGAILNGARDQSNTTCKASGLKVSTFNQVKRVFLGHFHRHNTYGNVTYVGAPTQFHFGDVDDFDRGYVIYDPKSDTFRLFRNPYAFNFINMCFKSALGRRVDGKYVQVEIKQDEVDDGQVNTDSQNRLRQKLLKNGAKKVSFKHPKKRRVIRQKQESVTPFDLTALLKEYVRSRELDESYETYMIDIVRGECAVDSTTSCEATFIADISEIQMCNFMGIREPAVALTFDDLKPGVYIIEGSNGSGKSTLLEAFAWCLYGKTFRECKPTEVINIHAGKNGAMVEIKFKNGYMFRRERKGAKMSLRITRPDGATMTHGILKNADKEVVDILKVDWETFAKTIMLSSSRTVNFLTSKEHDKKAILERLLGFELFETFLKQIQTDLSNSTDQNSELNRLISGIDERIAESERCTEKEKESDQVDPCLEESLQYEIIQLKTDITNLDTLKNECIVFDENIREQISFEIPRLYVLQDILKNMKEVHLDYPTDVRVDNAVRCLSEYLSDGDPDRRLSLIDKQKRKRQQLLKHSENMESKKMQLAAAKQKLYEYRFKARVQDVQTVQNEANLATMRDIRKTHIESQRLNDAKRAIHAFWKSAFTLSKTKGDFRTFCMNKRAEEINLELAKNIEIMSDDMTHNIACHLTPTMDLAELDGAIPWKQRSDGQKRRSELALFFAVVKKTRETGSFCPLFMFMDEIYDALDENGQQAVHNWILENTSLEMGEKTFVITHSVHRTSSCTGTIYTTWTDRGTHYQLA